MQDEPVLGPGFDKHRVTESLSRPVNECIRDLVAGQPFAVLCTQGAGQPYGSIVAFAFDPDLKSFVFTTPKATRKYELLSSNDRVALVVDNRGEHLEDMMQVGAVTVTGRARQLEPGPEYDRRAQLLAARHPYLESFVDAPSTALFRIDAIRFLYVTRFQEVTQWLPA